MALIEIDGLPFLKMGSLAMLNNQMVHESSGGIQWNTLWQFDMVNHPNFNT